MSNDEIFAAAYREHYWAVSRYVARRLSGRADEVEEVVAEVFTVAWRRRAELPAAPLPWLYGVARNCLANAVRGYGRRRRLVDRLGNDETAHGRHIAAGPGSEAPGAWVHEALDRLSPADQEVLRLAAWEELGAEEIAVALGCGRRAAAMRLHRARHRLRTEITRLRPRTPATAPPTAPGPGATTPLPEPPADPPAEAGAGAVPPPAGSSAGSRPGPPPAEPPADALAGPDPDAGAGMDPGAVEPVADVPAGPRQGTAAPSAVPPAASAVTTADACPREDPRHG
ncbi:hypothetical protein GCM10010501_22430 [Streptomyces libani subsp. rufus]|nr:hypothetical protein GCM10010501_22430 [Streptomyces libani subsp. rufus]